MRKLLIIGLLGCALFAAAPASAAYPGANGELAYVGFSSLCDTCSSGIQAIDPDGSNDHQLLNPSPGLATAPMWSPDGRLITYYRGGARGVWVANADGS